MQSLNHQKLNNLNQFSAEELSEEQAGNIVGGVSSIPFLLFAGDRGRNIARLALTEKNKLGLRFPSDGPGRDGTGDISAWD